MNIILLILFGMQFATLLWNIDRDGLKCVWHNHKYILILEIIQTTLLGIVNLI